MVAQVIALTLGGLTAKTADQNSPPVIKETSCEALRGCCQKWKKKPEPHEFHYINVEKIRNQNNTTKI